MTHEYSPFVLELLCILLQYCSEHTGPKYILMGAAGDQLASAGGEDYLVAWCKLPTKTFLKADI